MKIVMIYRKPRAGAFSIEGLFDSIRNHLVSDMDIQRYEVRGGWRLLLDVIQLRRLNADIYHITGDVSQLTLLLPARKLVLTIHDLGHFLFDLRGVKKWLYHLLWLKWPAQRAAAVTAVSEATAEHINIYLGLPHDRVQVIENCYGPDIRNEPKDFNAAKPTILQMGTAPHKNAEAVIDALDGIACKLVLVGLPTDSIESKLAQSEIQAEVKTGLSAASMADVYSAADVVTFVSRSEGFGLPVIEAQASGRALVTSNIPPMSDIAGPGACLVSPHDVGEIRAAILRIMADPAYRQSVIESGLRNAGRYSIPIVSESYRSLYERLLKTG